ncbi:hypothetical protein AX17_001750 [Amanita inopinata Kibby_2008]|nr:hypothetical protein AX17_001750 [Amanita inopinata Kibby_2008]
MENVKRVAVGKTVRTPGAPSARPKAALTRKVSLNRESNALRASVLDVALELGLGTNSTVADWMFNNPVKEEEEEPASPPAPTYGSSISEESSSIFSARFPYTPPSSSRSVSSSLASSFSPQRAFYPAAAAIPEEPPSIVEVQEEPKASTEGAPKVASSYSVTFPDAPTMPLTSIAPRRIQAKLKKRRADGYDSDAGYISDGGSKKKDNYKEKDISGSGKKDGEKTGSNEKDAKTRAKEEKELAKKVKEEQRKRAKSLTTRGNSKDTKADESLIPKGYETDAPPRRSRFGRKKKSATLDTDYETDAGYLSTSTAGAEVKKKTRFFRFGGKSSKPDLTQSVKQVPSVPPIPVPLPIAEKFGTVLGTTNAASNLPAAHLIPSLDPSLITSASSQTLLPPSSPVSSIVSAPPAPSSTWTPWSPVKGAKDSMSEKRTRDSNVSGESSRSSASNISISGSAEAQMPKRRGFRLLSISKPVPSPSKFPVISLPITRATSPSPSSLNVSVGDQTQDRSELLISNISRSPSPSPSKGGSSQQQSHGHYPSPSSTAPSYLSPNPESQRSISPALLPPSAPSLVVSSASAPSSPAPSRPSSFVRQRSSSTIATNDIGPPLSATAPNTVSANRLSGIAPNTNLAKRLSYRGRSSSPIPSLGVNTTMYINSTNNGNLSVPISNSNMLTYYDVPPPSPPPNGPLPRVPDRTQDTEEDPFAINGTSLIRTSGNAGRGKEAPFPMQPVSQRGFRARLRASMIGSNGEQRNAGMSNPNQAREPRTITIDRKLSPERQLDRVINENSEDEGDYEGGREILNVLERFTDIPKREENETVGKALVRSRSLEALADDVNLSLPNVQTNAELGVEDAKSAFEDTESYYGRQNSHRRRSTVYYSDPDEEDGADPRLSKWSESIYSRSSFMDSQRSEETRDRFVRRVEAMLDEAGIERGNKRRWETAEAVPPVPKLPEALAQRNVLLRQNQLKSAGAPMANPNRWNRF